MTLAKRRRWLRQTRWLALWVGLLLLTPAVFAQGTVEIELDVPVSDTLTADTPLQVYVLSAEANVTYIVSLINESELATDFGIFDAAGAAVQTESGGGSPNLVGGSASLRFTAPTGGDYFVVISSAAAAVTGGEIAYTLSVTVEDAEPAVETTAEPSADQTPVAAAPGQIVTTAGLTFTLSWSASADLDIEIRDPVGGSLYWQTPSVLSGGSLGANVNQGCVNVVSENATETATWSPGGIPTGSYEILVYYQQPCAGTAPVSFTVDVRLDGDSLTPISGTVAPGQVYAARAVIRQDRTAETAAGGVVELEALPFAASEMLAVARPVSFDVTTSGFIGNDQPFQSYRFDGQANEIVTISTTATSGSLDTYVALLDSQGRLIVFNDDLGQGITDSLISGALLPTTDSYTIVVSRYAKDIGGTEGSYDLLVTQQTANLSREFLNLPDGSLEFLLLWNTAADVQLLVRDPAGDSVFDDVPRVPSGGQILVQGNVNCRVSEGTPFSYITWPLDRQPRPGVYEIEVWFQSTCNDPTPVNFNLYVTYNGRQVLRATDTLRGPIFRADAPPIPGERYLTSFTLNPDGTTVLSDGGIIRGLETLDYRPEIASAPALVAGQASAGSITQDNKFDVYTYEGRANSAVTIALNATSGTLDTTLYLVSPSGQLIAENDDAIPGENTNSLIADFTLPETGRYIIIVTHYGALFGGTTGTYTLTLTELS